MLKSKRQLVFLAALSMLLYLVPNLVQDVHRVWGHHEYKNEFSSTTGIQFHNHYDKCAICVFEFNVVDELADLVYLPVLQRAISLFVENRKSQIYFNAFHYYNLRAPPQA